MIEKHDFWHRPQEEVSPVQARQARPVARTKEVDRHTGSSRAARFASSSRRADEERAVTLARMAEPTFASGASSLTPMRSATATQAPRGAASTSDYRRRAAGLGRGRGNTRQCTRRRRLRHRPRRRCPSTSLRSRSSRRLPSSLPIILLLARRVCRFRVRHLRLCRLLHH